jgi:hypothetical protein
MKEEILEYCGVDIMEEDMFLSDVFDKALLGVCYSAEDGYTPAYDLNHILSIIESENKNDSISELNNLIEKHPMISFIKYSDESQNELSKYNTNMLFLDGYGDNCLVGVCFRIGHDPISVYNDTYCVDYLIEHDNMDETDAVEYFEYNTRGSYAGENTPTFLTLLQQ